MAAILKSLITPPGVLAKKFRGRKVFVVPGPETDVSLLDLLTHYPFLFLSPHPWFEDPRCLFARHDVVQAHTQVVVTQCVQHFKLNLCEQQLHTNKKWRLLNAAEAAWVLCHLKLAGISFLQDREVRTSSTMLNRRPTPWLCNYNQADGWAQDEKRDQNEKLVHAYQHVCIGEYGGHIVVNGRHNDTRRDNLGAIFTPI